MSTKISQLTSATDITASDLMQIVDVEDGVMAPSGTNKKVTASLLAKELAKQPLEPGIVISGSSSGDAVRITQTGSGNALVVEDSANPDSTPFVVAGNGNVGIGTGTPSVKLDVFANSAIARFAGGTSEYQGIIIQPTESSASVSKGAFIDFRNENNVALANLISYHLTDGSCDFFINTTPTGSRTEDRRVEALRIKGNGSVGIGTITPNSKLHVAGDLTMSSATVATSATAGTNGDVPAQVAGYLVVNINGTARKIPYYA